MRRFRIAGLALCFAALVAATPYAADVHIIVVVNSVNVMTTIQRERLSKIFRREIPAWENGQEILPVDQIDKSPARIAFARDVHHQSVSALKRYWQERIFSGSESPPPERVTDAEVLTYVRSNPGSIGYVVEGTALTAGVKQLSVTE